MEFKSKAIDIETIRLDGGTQVRERLDEEYVSELADVFTDNRHGEIPPVVVFRDADGLLWLADGFHRQAAAVRSGSQTLRAEVRAGSLDEAKLYAARANTRNGMRLNAGDKTRAVRLADAAARACGKPMGVRELARHVGCDHALVSRALGVVTSHHVDDAGAERQTHRRSVALLWARIDSALKTNPDQLSSAVAAEIGCGESVVRDRRKALGLPPISRGAAASAKGQAKRDAVRQALMADPDSTNRSIADRVGNVAPSTVAEVRSELGLPARAPGGGVRSRQEEPDSAPEQHEKDQRSKPEVIPAKPPSSTAPVTDVLQRIERMDDTNRWTLAVRLASKWPRWFSLPNPKDVAAE